MKELGMRVLLTLGDNDVPRMTCVRAISPNGKYALLSDYAAGGDCPGWTAISGFEVVDVLGPQDEPEQTLYKRLCALFA